VRAAQGAAQGAARQAVRGYVGYEEWLTSRMMRREVARCGVALILAFGEPLDVHDSIEGRGHPLRAFVVGNQSIVEDVDAHYARSKAAGARIGRAPTDQPYGSREYGARDPENHRWWFSSPLTG